VIDMGYWKWLGKGIKKHIIRSYVKEPSIWKTVILALSFIVVCGYLDIVVFAGSFIYLFLIAFFGSLSIIIFGMTYTIYKEENLVKR